MSIFRYRLRELRGETRQQDIADALGVSIQSYSAYENGREPSYDILDKIADHFGVSTDYLLGRVNEKKPENVSIAGQTGLSEESVEQLKKMKNNVFFLDLLIRDKLFPMLIHTIGEYVLEDREQFMSPFVDVYNATEDLSLRNKIWEVKYRIESIDFKAYHIIMAYDLLETIMKNCETERDELIRRAETQRAIDDERRIAEANYKRAMDELLKNNSSD